MQINISVVLVPLILILHPPLSPLSASISCAAETTSTRTDAINQEHNSGVEHDAESKREASLQLSLVGTCGDGDSRRDDAEPEHGSIHFLYLQS
jgi:hypothetical protein